MPTVDLQMTNASGKAVPVRQLRPLLLRAAALQNIRAGHWQVTFVGDAAMKALHARTMNDSTTTDVMTFDLRDRGAPATRLDLDTVICRDVAAREARRRGHPLLAELTLYAVHSLLHVTGHDDLTKADAARMHAREDELLEALGLGAVYAAVANPKPRRYDDTNRRKKE
jgi:probable rRNA maturation factor